MNGEGRRREKKCEDYRKEKHYGIIKTRLKRKIMNEHEEKR